MSMPETAVDFAPLFSDVSRSDIAEFKTESQFASHTLARLKLGVNAVIGLVVVIVVFVGVMVAAFWLMGPLVGALVEGTTPDVPTVLIIATLIGVVVLIGSVRQFLALAPGMTPWSRWLRLSRFASANDLHFSPSDLNPSYPGSVFPFGEKREILEHLYRSDGRFLDIGNFRWEISSDESRTVYNWGFLALQLDRTLPNMVLDARSNNKAFGGSNLPLNFSPDQRLSLEGDFDKYFTLYCPREYETDALYIFTPDLMALLIDHTNKFDVEIVDHWMLLYSTTILDLTDVPTLEHLFRIVDTVGAKTVSQTHRYADERVGDRSLDAVAPQGKRLTQHVPRWLVIAVIAFMVLWVGLEASPIVINVLAVLRFLASLAGFR